MNDSTSVGKRLQNHEIGPEFDMFTQVIIHAGQVTDEDGNTKDLDYIAGDTTGRTLEVNDPNGTQAKANALLAKLQNSKFQYQPYRADKALLDPAAELGDGISVSDTFSAIYNRDLTFSSLMAADLEAPSDEEIEHEFPYIPKADREYKRETQFTRSQIKINEKGIALEASTARANEQSLSAAINVQAGRITQEVSDRQSADTAMSSLIEQTADSIRNEVVKKADGKRTSFGWNLTASGWEVYSNNKTVLKATSGGLEVSGKITATSGYIGNGSSVFTIDNKAIRNGMSELDDTQHNGIYLGTDGIALGAGKFKVTYRGKLTATDATISGKITATSGYIGTEEEGFQIGSNYIRNGTKYLSDTTPGIFLGTTGISVYKDDTHYFRVNVSDGSLTLRGGMSGRDDTQHTTGMFIGASGIALGGGKFKVTNAGKLTASDVTITGGSISIKDTKDVTTFSVTNQGKLTAKSGTIAGFSFNDTLLYKNTAASEEANNFQRRIAINAPVTPDDNTMAFGIQNRKYNEGKQTYGSWKDDFRIDYDGTVTATKLNFNGGSIKIGNNFEVTKEGAVTARSGEIAGFEIKDNHIGKWTENTAGKTDGHGVWIDATREYIQLGKCRINNDGKIYILKDPDQGLGDGNSNVAAYIDSEGTFYNGSVDGWIGDGDGHWTPAANAYGAGLGVGTTDALYDTFTKEYIITESVLIGNNTQGSLHLGGLGFKVATINGIQVWAVDMS